MLIGQIDSIQNDHIKADVILNLTNKLEGYEKNGLNIAAESIQESRLQALTLGMIAASRGDQHPSELYRAKDALLEYLQAHPDTLG